MGDEWVALLQGEFGNAGIRLKTGDAILGFSLVGQGKVKGGEKWGEEWGWKKVREVSISLDSTYEVTYVHDLMGRFSSVTAVMDATTNTFPYTSLPGTSLLSGYSSPSDFFVTYACAPIGNRTETVEGG